MAPQQLQVPQTENIADVYATDDVSAQSVAPEIKARWQHLIKQFTEIYSKKPDFVARSPGRVNIIGEHIDYNLYDVLPTAVSVDVIIAVKVVPTEGSEAIVKISNVNPQKFPSREFSVPFDKDVVIDPKKHEWVNYFKAGLVGALKFLRKGNPSVKPVSLEVLLDGNVPPGGGISSSAAFVCASALAVIKANGHDVSKENLLDLAVVSERAVGVYSGGMDQAASIFSQRGFLLYTKFFPKFSVEHVPIPVADEEIVFLVAQSFVTSNKAETGPRHYNLRVAECTLAAVVLAKHHGIVLEKDNSSLGYSLRNLHEEFMRKQGRLQDPLEYQLDAVIQSTTEILSQEQGYTREEIAKLLDITVPELGSRFLSSFPVEAERFKLRQRALHCFKEARRVLDFKACLSQADKLDIKRIHYLGQLLNETQDSCRDDYECSCPEVDQICEIARRAGTWGSRLTGAGWGGCTVHMLPRSKVEAVSKALHEEYYSKLSGLTQEQLSEAIVISKPSNGSFLVHGAALELA
ncbi:galactokinase [Talaromyces stipitatus ATCC 10500]|uniref:Galactokinase n=1 Tax=Talaromyces stipitatus (strain ATCC 10500 / CBS 375.48 / QM 6759 / NRRL 1006) TaxID=441959 RepID=B8M7J6_TALSN|nr:galactokinase [Talaromyces stipitatus ATCC 10500]EED19549.1 galactokinase [Talaromyces stipitatus ATCC 10500]